MDEADTTLHRGMTNDVVTLDPHLSVQAEAVSVLHDLYEGLTRIDARGQVQPATATSWVVSDDGLAYTFKIRADARFSDGSRVIAKSFVDAFERAVNPATASPHADKFSIIDGAAAIVAGDAAPQTLAAEAIDDQTLRIRLSYPAPYFRAMLAHSAFAPLPLPESNDSKFGSLGSLVSNGPYRLTGRAIQQYVDLSVNRHHWNFDPAMVEHVRYVVFESDGAQLNAYRTDAVELTDTVPIAANELVAERFADEMIRRPSPNVYYYGFNLRNGPLAGSRELRQALSTAIHRELIVENVTRGGQSPAYAFVPPVYRGYTSPLVEWKNPDAQIRSGAATTMPAKSSRLRLLYNTNEGIQKITVAVASMWRKALGLDTDLRNQEFKVFLQSIQDPSRWDIVRLSWFADYDDPYTFLEIFTSNSPNNIVGFSDPSYDELVASANRASTFAERMRLLSAAEARLLNAYAVAPVFYYTDTILAKPWIDVGERDRLLPLPTAELRIRTRELN